MVADSKGMEIPTLRDGDLVLRPKRREDLDAITAACQDPEIPRWTFVPSPYTRADAEAYFERSANEAAAGRAVNLLRADRVAAGGRRGPDLRRLCLEAHIGLRRPRWRAGSIRARWTSSSPTAWSTPSSGSS
jgi:hypothetical protein